MTSLKMSPHSVLLSVILLARGLHGQGNISTHEVTPQWTLRGVLETAAEARHESGKSIIVDFRKTNSPEKIAADIDAWIKRNSDPEDLTARNSDSLLLTLYYQPVCELLRRLIAARGEPITYFYGKDDVPAKFVLIKGSLALFVSSIESGRRYNTLKTTSRSRAADALQTILLPLARTFVDVFRTDSEDIKYFGLSLIYGSEDFSEKYPTLMKETLSVVLPSDKCRRFVNGELSEDELVAEADVYVSDRDMQSGIKKLKLSLE